MSDASAAIAAALVSRRRREDVCPSLISAAIVFSVFLAALISPLNVVLAPDARAVAGHFRVVDTTEQVSIRSASDAFSWIAASWVDSARRFPQGSFVSLGSWRLAQQRLALQLGLPCAAASAAGGGEGSPAATFLKKSLASGAGLQDGATGDGAPSCADTAKSHAPVGGWSSPTARAALPAAAAAGFEEPYEVWLPFWADGAAASDSWAGILSSLQDAGWVDARTTQLTAQLLVAIPSAGSGVGAWVLVTATFNSGAQGVLAPIGSSSGKWMSAAAAAAPPAGSFTVSTRPLPWSLPGASSSSGSSSSAAAALWRAAALILLWLWACVARRLSALWRIGSRQGALAAAAGVTLPDVLLAAAAAAVTAAGAQHSTAAAAVSGIMTAANSASWSPASAQTDAAKVLAAAQVADTELAVYRDVAVAAIVLITAHTVASFSVHPRLGVVGSSLARALADSIHFAAVFAALMAMYAAWGFASFGHAAVADWGDLPSSLWSCIRLIMYDYDLQSMAGGDPQAARWFFGSFMFIMTNLILWAALAVIFDAYALVRAETAGLPAVLVSLLDSAALFPGVAKAHVRRAMRDWGPPAGWTWPQAGALHGVTLAGHQTGGGSAHLAMQSSVGADPGAAFAPHSGSAGGHGSAAHHRSSSGGGWASGESDTAPLAVSIAPSAATPSPPLTAESASQSTAIAAPSASAASAAAAAVSHHASSSSSASSTSVSLSVPLSVATVVSAAGTGLSDPPASMQSATATPTAASGASAVPLAPMAKLQSAPQQLPPLPPWFLPPSPAQLLAALADCAGPGAASPALLSPEAAPQLVIPVIPRDLLTAMCRYIGGIWAAQPAMQELLGVYLQRLQAEEAAAAEAQCAQRDPASVALAFVAAALRPARARLTPTAAGAGGRSDS